MEGCVCEVSTWADSFATNGPSCHVYRSQPNIQHVMFWSIDDGLVVKICSVDCRNFNLDIWTCAHSWGLSWQLVTTKLTWCSYLANFKLKLPVHLLWTEQRMQVRSYVPEVWYNHRGSSSLACWYFARTSRCRGNHHLVLSIVRFCLASLYSYDMIANGSIT